MSTSKNYNSYKPSPARKMLPSGTILQRRDEIAVEHVNEGLTNKAAEMIAKNDYQNKTPALPYRRSTIHEDINCMFQLYFLSIWDIEQLGIKRLTFLISKINRFSNWLENIKSRLEDEIHVKQVEGN